LVASTDLRTQCLSLELAPDVLAQLAEPRTAPDTLVESGSGQVDVDDL
jgi:hypothetical protein